MSSAIPPPAERDALNAALLANGTETGFWDDNGRPAPWPQDIDEWAPEGRDQTTVPAHVDPAGSTLST